MTRTNTLDAGYYIEVRYGWPSAWHRFTSAPLSETDAKSECARARRIYGTARIIHVDAF